MMKPLHYQMAIVWSVEDNCYLVQYKNYKNKNFCCFINIAAEVKTVGRLKVDWEIDEQRDHGNPIPLL
jgi:hypothetical protein